MSASTDGEKLDEVLTRLAHLVRAMSTIQSDVCGVATRLSADRRLIAIERALVTINEDIAGLRVQVAELANRRRARK